MSHLYVSSSAAERLGRALEWLRSEPRGEILVVAASRGAADDLLRRAAAEVGDQFAVHRTTPLHLAYELAALPLAEAGRKPLTGLALHALATLAVTAARAEGELGYFTPVAAMPGFPRALAETLTELRLEDVGPDLLSRGDRSSRDLAILYRRFEAELGRFGLADRAALYEAALSAIEESRHRWVGLPLLLLDVAPQTAAEARLFGAMGRRAPSWIALVAALEERAAGRLADALGTVPEPLESPPAGRATAIARARAQLFALDAPEPRPATEGRPASGEGERAASTARSSRAEVPGEEGDVELFSAPGEDRECVEIVRRILARAGAGVPFDDLAILLRQPQTYLPLLEDALRRGGVPAWFNRGTTRPDPAGRAFLALLACAAEGLTASRFAEYLSLGEAPDPDPSGAPPPVEEVPWVEPSSEDQLVFKSLLPVGGTGAQLDPGAPTHSGQTLPAPAAWERLLVDAAVIGGRDRWRRRLAGLREELSLRLRHASDEEAAETEYLGRQIARLDSLTRFALPIVDALAELPETARWGEWLVALDRLALLVLRDPERVRGLLTEMRPMAEVGPVSLEQVRDVLADRLSVLRRDPPPRRYGRVFVGTVPDALGRSFDTVFLPGLSEGLFPRKPFEDPLLLDAQRVVLDAHRAVRGAPGAVPGAHRAVPGAQLALQEDRFAGERGLLRLALGAARERLVASYPRIDQRLGRARVPSFYALDLLRAAYGEMPDLRSYERPIREPVPEPASASAGVAAAASPAPAPLSASLGAGWPAPDDPAAAIDDAEFDLSVLGPLLQRPPREIRGRARYLVHANAHLYRSLQARWYRWRPSWSLDDGLVVAPDAPPAPRPDRDARDPAATLELLARELPSARSYSPTALQNFAACPYRFLLQAIHRLRPREDRTSPEQLDPLTRGSLFHETQFAFFAEVRERSLLPLHRDFETDLLDLADRALESVAGRYEEDLAPAIPRIWRSEIEGLRTDLRGWIKKLLEADDGFSPSHFEFAFGLDEPEGRQRDAASTAEPALTGGGFRLRGSIDLVERDWRRRALRVTDHKTGRAPQARSVVIGHGELLQPVLYALAAEALLAGEGEQVEAGRLFYCTQRGGYAQIDVPLDERSRAYAKHVLDSVESAVKEGFLPAAPREEACSWCDYRIVCGPHEEARAARKKQERLERLQALRRLE